MPFPEIALGVFLLAGFLLSRPAGRFVIRFAHHTALWMAFLAALPVALRLALIRSHPVPNPRVSDDFSYLLLGDTFAHFRLANAAHPMRRFFEGVFTLQDPSWSSSYPPGQGLALAAGQLIGHPWIGVLASVGILCALCYWMLRAWVSPAWALVGGFLAVMEFGPLSSWMNSYWGGAVSGIAGCLIFGAIPRIRTSGRTRDSLFLGLGLGLQMITRPYEFVFVLLGAAAFIMPRRAWAVAALALLPAAGLTLIHNQRVTGDFTTLPYQLSQRQYGIPASFTWQAMPVPGNSLTAEQRMDYEAQSAAHVRATFTTRAFERVRFYRFFFFAPLYIALLFFIPAVRNPAIARVVLVVALLHAGTAFYPYFYPHYIAVATCLFVLMAVKGLERMPPDAARVLFLLCLAQFAFWYGVHASGHHDLLKYNTANVMNDVINEGDPQNRMAVNVLLSKQPGQQLVFVRYWPQHGPHEWIHNAADIDAAPVVWALDLGPEEDAVLQRYYPNRKAWLLEPDANPPRLTPFNGR